MSVIVEYMSDVIYIRGRENIVADCLSRPTNAVSVDLFDLPALAQEQKEDEEIKSFQDRLKKFPPSEEQIFSDVSTPYPRPFVPIGSRKVIFETFHIISHPGTNASLKLIKSRYFWPSMDKTLEIGLVNVYLAKKVRSTDSQKPVFKNLASLRQDLKLCTSIS